MLSLLTNGWPALTSPQLLPAEASLGWRASLKAMGQRQQARRGLGATPATSAPGTAGTSVPLGPASHTLLGSLPLFLPNTRNKSDSTMWGSEPQSLTRKPPPSADSKKLHYQTETLASLPVDCNPEFKNPTQDQVQDDCPAIPEIHTGTEPAQDPRITLVTTNSESSMLSLLKTVFHFKIKLRMGEQHE